MQNKYKNILIIGLGLIVSFGLGIIFNDYFVGPLTLCFGFLSAYYMAAGKWQNYIFGILFSIIYSYDCCVNHLYGFAIFTALVYTPLQIVGIVNWIKHKNNEEVTMQSLKWKKASLLCVGIILVSLLISYLLSLIPTQELPLMDSFSQIINISAVVLVSLRFRESWYLFLLNSAMDFSIWIVKLCTNSIHIELILITSVMYLIMNLIGLIKWIKIEKLQKQSQIS